MKYLEDKPLSFRTRVKIKVWTLKFQWAAARKFIEVAQKLCPHSFASIHQAESGDYYSICGMCEKRLED